MRITILVGVIAVVLGVGAFFQLSTESRAPNITSSDNKELQKPGQQTQLSTATHANDEVDGVRLPLKTRSSIRHSRAPSATVINVEYLKGDRDGDDFAGDIIKSTYDDKSILIEVFSEFGFGEGAIKLVEGDWTESVVIRFYLGGLEGLYISNGKVTLTEIPTKIFDEHGKPYDGKYLASGGKYTGKGYYEVAVPKALIDKDTKSITIEWIDYYRR